MKVTKAASKVVLFVPAEELSPGGVLALPALGEALVKRYQFAQYPKTREEWLDPKGSPFAQGRVGPIEINRLIIYSNAVELTAQTTTEGNEQILEEMLIWATSLGLQYTKNDQRFRWPTSELTFTSDISLDALHPAVRALGDELSRIVTQSFRMPALYQTTAVALNLDDMNLKIPPGPFRLERRQGIPFTENMYYSIAPLTTNDHVRVLEQFEAALATETKNAKA
jgi:hypothetical protein